MIQLAGSVPVMSFMAGKVVPQTRVTIKRAAMPRRCLGMNDLGSGGSVDKGAAI